MIVPLPTPEAPIITRDFRLFDIFIRAQIILYDLNQDNNYLLLMQDYKI